MKLQLFNTEPYLSLEYQVFLKTTKLGRLLQAIPFDKIIEQLPIELKNEKPTGPNSMIGGVRGGLALQFLKMITCFSDEMLVEHLNTDYSYQYFCGFRLKIGESIKDKDLVGRWRRKLAPWIMKNGLTIIQEVLATAWKEHMEETFVLMMDATCYESQLRYPCDVKLLWESCSNLMRLVKSWKKYKGCSLLLKRFSNEEKAYLNYSKSKKRTHKKRQKSRKNLLKLLEKLLLYVNTHRKNQKNPPIINKWFAKRIETIETVYKQQKYMYDSCETKVENRVCSLHKPYVRPIVRGKEVKKVEFGAKAHKIQINGIGFLERINFNSFNEGIRLKESVKLHRQLIKKKCSQIAADAIYANNANRKFCSENNITTSFIQKGRKPTLNPEKADQISKMRSLLGKERATVLEGSFGSEKERYNLKLIKAKREDTEFLWICFGVWTFSAIKIANRIQKKKSQKRAA